MTEEKRGLSPALMVLGTSSDVGKSVIVTALCRIFTNDGLRAAPFKSQNMSLNSYVTPDGKEIGRAQAVQADACRIPATTDMNPILLKPTGERMSQVVVHGKPLRNYDAVEYRERYLPTAGKIVRDALDRLRGAYDIVVMEGAGSPAEVNLRDRDIVNMRAAAWGDAPVLLVADIDRGGVFAAIVGTMAILSPEERERVKGFIINKFRGDPSLLTPGLEWLEAETGKPVLGVVPMLPEIGLEDEDSASLANRLAEGRRTSAKRERQLDIAVVHLPRMSNFTDFDALAGEPDVTVRYIRSVEDWGEPDAVILPGTKNTMEDLEAVRGRGMDEAIVRFARGGGHVAGICGGYQMMGRALVDPDGVESSLAAITGLALLPMDTVYASEKKTVRVAGAFAGWPTDKEGSGTAVEGYEIHMGVTTFRDYTAHPFTVYDGGQSRPDGAMSQDGSVWGTYIHGIFDNDEFRRSWLNRLRESKGWEPLPLMYRHREQREAAFERLSEHVRTHVDMDAIYRIAGVSNMKGGRNL